MKGKAPKQRRRNDDMDLLEWLETFLVLIIACGLVFYILTKEGALWFV